MAGRGSVVRFAVRLLNNAELEDAQVVIVPGVRSDGNLAAGERSVKNEEAR